MELGNFSPNAASAKGKLHIMIKFSTIPDEWGADIALMPEAQQLTPVGHFFRVRSLDELPDLSKVLKREMSLRGLVNC